MRTQVRNLKMKVGDLVYIPSNTYLSNTGDIDKTSAFTQIKAPKVLLVLEQDEKNYRIMFEGKKWYVSKKDVFKVKEGKN